MIRFQRAAALLGFSLAAASSLAGTAWADKMQARYAVTLVGLPIGSASADGSIDDTGYKLEVTARLSGLAAMVSSSKAALVATGGVGSNGVLPATYATTAANDKETRTVRMAMSAGTVKGVDISPPIEEQPGRVPLTEASKRNSLDPVSALLMQVPAGQPMLGPASCPRSIPVFDGYTRFDITMSYVGTKNVKTKGYAGPVVVCAVRYTPVAGHRPDRKGTQFMANNRKIEAWLAPIEKSRMMVPFHVSMATMVGTAVIDATEFNISPSQSAAGR